MIVFRSALILAFIASIFSGVVACSKKGSDGVDAEGHCTQATVDANNAIVSVNDDPRPGYFKMTSDQARLNAAEAQCASFENLVGGKSCTANDAATGTPTTITTASTQLLCTAIKEKLHPGSVVDIQAPPARQEGPVLGAGPISRAESRPLISYRDRISLSIQDAAIFKHRVFFIQAGQLVAGASGLMPGRDYCEAQVTKPYPTKKALPVKLDFDTATGGVTFFNQTIGFSLICTKVTLPVTWTVDAAKDVFGDLIRLDIKGTR